MTLRQFLTKFRPLHNPELQFSHNKLVMVLSGHNQHNIHYLKQCHILNHWDLSKSYNIVIIRSYLTIGMFYTTIHYAFIVPKDLKLRQSLYDEFLLKYL